MDTPNQAPNNAPQGAQKNNVVMAVLAYLGILVVIPYIVSKADAFVKFHIKQGLILLVIEIVVWMLARVLWIFWPLWNLVNLAVLVLSIIGIVNAVKGREKELPLVGHMASKFTI